MTKKKSETKTTLSTDEIADILNKGSKHGSPHERARIIEAWRLGASYRYINEKISKLSRYKITRILTESDELKNQGIDAEKYNG